MCDNYVGTYWRSIESKYKYNIFAVVFQNGNTLTAWELELRENNLYHPAYGTISRSDVNDIDVFTNGIYNRLPSFIFNISDRDFYFAGDDIDNILWLPPLEILKA